MNIKRSAWAMKFKREYPLQYDEAIYYASESPVQVFVSYSNEIDPENPSYMIVVDWTDFWLGAFPTREEAVKLCNRMGWEIINA